MYRVTYRTDLPFKPQSRSPLRDTTPGSWDLSLRTSAGIGAIDTSSGNGFLYLQLM